MMMKINDERMLMNLIYNNEKIMKNNEVEKYEKR
jgi:hypothetical protein